MSPEHPVDIECPECGGTGKDCDACIDGRFELNQCPSKFIGQELISDIEIVVASKRHLPVAGGLLDQSAWWFELKQQLEREQNIIEAERMRADR